MHVCMRGEGKRKERERGSDQIKSYQKFNSRPGAVAQESFLTEKKRTLEKQGEKWHFWGKMPVWLEYSDH